ncbi:MAG: hypothetical protein PWR20_1037 [Bacteroidales bacterium]|nr:hypothetical protein [Bacteroidales bacterium]
MGVAFVAGQIKQGKFTLDSRGMNGSPQTDFYFDIFTQQECVALGRTKLRFLNLSARQSRKS